MDNHAYQDFWFIVYKQEIKETFILSSNTVDEVDWKFKCFIHSWVALSSSTPGSAVYGDAQASAHRLYIRVCLKII